MTIVPGFTGSPLDRIDAARHDEALVAAMRADPAALLLLLDGLHPLGAEDGTLGWAPLAEVQVEVELALLGRLEGRPQFVALTPGVSGFKRTPELFAAITALPPQEAGTYAAARSLIDWHARHRFCANCGARDRSPSAPAGRAAARIATASISRASIRW